MPNFTYNAERNWEWHMGNDEYMVFCDKPVFSIEKRNPYKENYENVLKQLTDGKQKILTDKIEYETGHYQNTDFEWYRNIVESEKPNFTDYEAMKAFNNRVVEYHYGFLFNKYNGIVNTCPLDIKIKGHINGQSIKQEDGNYVTIYTLSITLIMTLKKTMDLYKTLGDFGDRLVKSEWGDLNITLYSKYDNLISAVMFRYKSYMDNNYCDRLNFLGIKYSHTERSIGYECYNGDENLLLIDVLYARCGVSKSGKPLPNRIYKKNSFETVDNPWSYRGQADFLRKILKANKVKKYSKMNKEQMIEILRGL